MLISKPVTVSVKLWVASGATPFDAVKVTGKVPGAVGVPDSTPPVKVTPEGSAPDSEMVGAGFPLAVTVKLPAAPTLKVVELAEVMVGATWTVFTVKVKFCVASGAVPLVAVMVIG